MSTGVTVAGGAERFVNITETVTAGGGPGHCAQGTPHGQRFVAVISRRHRVAEATTRREACRLTLSVQGSGGGGRRKGGAMTSIQPELWVETPGEAVAFYEAAFGATVLHRVGEEDDIVAQLGVGDAAFWVGATSAAMKRLSPRAIDGATSRTLLVVEDPERVIRQAVGAGATESSPVSNEHGWRLGRIIDPFGHEWEIGVPLGAWPPS